jgi:hypothetical protein
VTLSASMAARLGSTPMAAFQICLQTWLACSLLADGLAFAGQVRELFLSLGHSFFIGICMTFKLQLIWLAKGFPDASYLLVYFLINPDHISTGYTCKCICS